MTTLSSAVDLSKARVLLVQSGNLMQTDVAAILNSAFKHTQKEVLNAVEEALRSATAKDAPVGTIHLDSTTLTVRHVDALTRTVERVKEDEVDDLELTAKLFLCCSHVNDAKGADATKMIEQVLQQLRARVGDVPVKNFTLAFSGFRLDDDEDDDESSDEEETSKPSQETSSTRPDMAYFGKVWRALESQYERKTVQSLGVCEFNRERLSSFLIQIKVKPTTNQVNMADCCVMPHKLIAYCREQGIQLVTHNDACPPLDEQALAHLWRTQSNMLKTQIQPLWILKFSTMLQSRGILADKGYILCATLSTDRN